MKIWHLSHTPEQRRQTDSQHLEVIQGGINICLHSDISVRSDGNSEWPFLLFMPWLLSIIQYIKGIVPHKWKFCHFLKIYSPMSFQTCMSYFLLWAQNKMFWRMFKLFFFIQWKSMGTKKKTSSKKLLSFIVQTEFFIFGCIILLIVSPTNHNYNIH